MSGLRLGPFPVTSGADLNMWTVALESPAERSNYVSLSYYHNLQLLYIIRTLCSESLVYLSRPTNIEKWEEEGQDGWRLWGWHVPDGGDAWGRGRRNNSLQGANLGACVWRLGRGLIFANCVTGTNPNYQVKPGQAGHYVSWYFVWKGHGSDFILFYPHLARAVHQESDINMTGIAIAWLNFSLSHSNTATLRLLTWWRREKFYL